MLCLSGEFDFNISSKYRKRLITRSWFYIKYISHSLNLSINKYGN